MEIFVILLKQNMIMLSYLLIGYILCQKKIVGLYGCRDLGGMLLYVIIPVVIIKSYLIEFSLERLEGFLVSFLMAVSSLFLSIFISWIVFDKNERVERFGAAFSNAGFIGIPLVQMTLGAEAVFYVAAFVAVLNILQWTYGILVMTGDKSAISFYKIRTNPIVISFIFGIILFFLPISLPDILNDVIGTIASINGPLAMIVLGVYLSQVPLKQLFKDKKAYCCTVVRLLQSADPNRRFCGAKRTRCGASGLTSIIEI